MTSDPNPAVRIDYALDDRYRSNEGAVYLNGMQALVRLLLMQKRRDTANGLRTAGFVSGYRGSPLGTLDMALWQASKHIAEHEIRFEPGLNEDLAATSVWGSQQASLMEPTHDGVFALWYGKGPGIDRSCDALKHGNYNGVSRHGGVLVVAGDDPGGKSSSLPHQSEPAMIHCGMPILAPADLQDMLDLGLHGWAMSRHSGCWVGFKCVTDLLDSSGTVNASLDRVQITVPEEDAGADHTIQWATYSLILEKRLHAERLPAAQRYARANRLDHVAFGAAQPRLGIVAAGKSYGDVRQALERLNIDQAEAEKIGLGVYKLALVWPIEPEGLRDFAQGLEAMLVVEEKRPIIEDQIAALLYAQPHRPRLSGKRDASGAPLLALDGELNPDRVVDALARWLGRTPPPSTAPAAGSIALMRLPAFCSGCPHNTSTKIPEGSQALAGIGCHGMAMMLPERKTLAYTHMGAEGSNWIGLSPFSRTRHIFQNMGDGTYSHSGVLAIRAAIAAKINITYKILVNGAVAMTGGQPIEGHAELGVAGVTESIARQLVAEGAVRVAVVTDDPERLAGTPLPAGVAVHHRDELDALQREMRDTTGVTAILYDQGCAAEKRRLRKRGRLEDPDRRLFIHEAVCEGCGDCSMQSNCIAVEPVETEYGRKRAINQDACNKDYSCLKGYCPSFAVLDGAKLKRRKAVEHGLDTLISDLPEPTPPSGDTRRILITGIGGTGVVTLGALLGMAAHLEGKSCRILDQTGAAQKNGAVTSHVHIAPGGGSLHATRITEGGADLVIGCDLVTTASLDALAKMAAARTQVIVNHDVAPTAQFARTPDLDLGASPLEASISGRVGNDAARFIGATSLARSLLGDDLGVNMLLLGIALQRGLLGVSPAALERAIELNGARVDFNKRALQLGRLCGHDLSAVNAAIRGTHPAAEPPGDWQALSERRADFLRRYQDNAYAQRYRDFVATVAEREMAVMGKAGPLALAVAGGYFKLLAYKDEYEVARLWTDPAIRARLDDSFEPGYRLQLSLAPQLPWMEDRASGRITKRLWGPWIFGLFRLLAPLRRLRGTPFDFCSWHPHRSRERALIGEYEHSLRQILVALSPHNHAIAVELAQLPVKIRGFGVVKDKSMAEAAQARETLLQRFEAAGPMQAAA